MTPFGSIKVSYGKLTGAIYSDLSECTLWMGIRAN